MNNVTEILGMSVQEYLAKLNSEKEYLTAAYLAHTGLTPDEVVLVERTTTEGMRFYPAPRDRQLDDVEPEIASLKAEVARLARIVRAADEMAESLAEYNEHDKELWDYRKARGNSGGGDGG